MVSLDSLQIGLAVVAALLWGLAGFAVGWVCGWDARGGPPRRP